MSWPHVRLQANMSDPTQDLKMQSGVPFHLHKGGLTVGEGGAAWLASPGLSVAHGLGTRPAGLGMPEPSRCQHPRPLLQDAASVFLSHRRDAALILRSFSCDFT